MSMPTCLPRQDALRKRMRLLESNERVARRSSLIGGFLFFSSTIDRAVIQAYLETEYIVYADAAAILRMGQPNVVLAQLHLAHGVESSAFLTACNPYSRKCDVAANAARQRRLVDRIEQDGFSYVDGVGQHPSNQWPGEASFLVLGPGLEQAKALGLEFEQNAIVWAGGDAVPQLILLR
jgi:hypothetical protein